MTGRHARETMRHSKSSRSPPVIACTGRSAHPSVDGPGAGSARSRVPRDDRTDRHDRWRLSGKPVRLHDSANLDLETCEDGLRLTGGSEGEEFGGPDRDENMTIYVVDVDGLADGVYERRLLDATPAQSAELEAIVASLRFEP